MIRIGIECESIEGKNPQWGVGRIITRLLEEISHRKELEKNFKFVLYFKDHIPNLPFLNSPIFEKKRVPVLFFKGRLFPIYYFALLPMKLWFEYLDLMFWPNYMLPIIATKKSLVVLTEDVYYETHSGKLPFRYRLAYGIFGWWTAKFATRIMAISETSKKNLAKIYKIDPNRIVVNHLGVDSNQISIRQLADKYQNYVSKIKNENYILYVGQMFPRRHAKETILAFELIAKEFLPILPPPELQNRGSSISQPNQRDLGEIGTNLKLILIGPDKYDVPIIDPLIKEVNTRLGREAVTHKNYVEDSELVELYAVAKALVYVSDHEAFGLPPMEALSFGVPPIIADNELSHELFSEYAFYAKGSSPEEIAGSLRSALTQDDKINRIKSQGPEFVKKYTWKSFADRFLNQINEII